MKFTEYRFNLEESAEGITYGVTCYAEQFEFVSRYIKGKCLEIGCGDGSWIGVLRGNSEYLVSLDLSFKRIERAKNNTKGIDVDFVLCDARVLPFRSNFFNTICAFEVIEHLPEYKDHFQFLSEVKRVLSPGGTLLISTPNRPIFRIYCKILREREPTHFTELNYLQFRTLLEEFFPYVKLYGKFGWLSPFYKFKFIRNLHTFLSNFTPFCKGLLGVCRK